MTTLQEAAMRDALEAAQKFCAKVESGNARSTETYADMKRVRDSLSSALAQQGEQPVAYLWFPPKKPELAQLSFQKEPPTSLKGLGYTSNPLYTAAPAPQPAQGDLVHRLRNCDVTWPLLKSLLNEAADALQSAQPVAPLTDDELWAIWDDYFAEIPSYDRPSFELALYRAMLEKSNGIKEVK